MFSCVAMYDEPAKVFRGSRTRLRRLKCRGNGSLELGLLIVWVVFLLLVVIPWIASHGY